MCLQPCVGQDGLSQNVNNKYSKIYNEFVFNLALDRMVLAKMYNKKVWSTTSLSSTFRHTLRTRLDAINWRCACVYVCVCVCVKREWEIQTDRLWERGERGERGEREKRDGERKERGGERKERGGEGKEREREIQARLTWTRPIVCDHPDKHPFDFR